MRFELISFGKMRFDLQNEDKIYLNKYEQHSTDFK